MNPEEYAAQQAVISAAIATYVLQLGQFFARPALTLAEWLGVLNFMFPEVQRQRDAAAALARVFYDSQRELAHPNLPRNDRFLETYDYEEFVQSMEPARQDMSRTESKDHALGALALRAVREVENGGRRQIINAVENDEALATPTAPAARTTPAARAAPATPTTTPTTPATPTRILGYNGEPVKTARSENIRGWARVATGRETCAWCLMLISRGPTYLGNDTAGLDLDETSALAAYRDKSDLQTYFEEIKGHMEEWHDGCDCKVVPVFKRESWFGEDAAKRALVLWNEATLEAKELREAKPGRTYKSGENKGKPITLNDDAINALRRRMSRGEIDPSEFAALAA